MKISLLIKMKMPTIIGIFILLAEEISCLAELSTKKYYNCGARLSEYIADLIHPCSYMA